MKELPRRAMLGAIALLCLLAGILMPAPDNGAIASEPLADLVIEAITWAPETPRQGDTVTFTVKIENRGDAQTIPGEVDCYVDGDQQALLRFGQLAPGAIAGLTFTWPGEPGSHNVRAVVDPGGKIDESDDGNNDVTFAFSVLAPDLIIDSITWSPRTPEIRDPVIISVTIRNQGNAYARASNTELFIDDASRGYYPVPGMEAGANYTMTYYWTAQAGSYEFRAVADVLRQVSEADEANNATTVSNSSANPDLIVSGITWSAVSASGNVTVSVTVTNQGTGKADQFHLAYYVDDEWQGTAYLPGLTANTTTTKTFSWEVWPGNHDIRAIADFNESVFESDEGNNATTAIYSAESVSPDFIIESISWSPTSPLVDHRLFFTVTVKNTGDGMAGSSYVRIYIDGTQKWQQPLPMMAAGATSNLSMSWTLPGGTHTIKATADPYNYVSESNEENNTKSASITGGSRPTYALQIEKITWAPASPTVGDTVTFTIRIKNGDAALGSPFHIAYFIDDSPRGTDYAGSLYAGMAVSKIFVWTAEPGTHTFRAVADFNEIIAEADKSDNEKSVSVDVAAADLVIEDIAWEPANPAPGETVIYTVTIRNRGAIRADRSTIAYYIDDDARGRHNLPELTPGTGVTGTFTWTAEAGTHTFKAIADSDRAVSEADEHNNEKRVTLPAPNLDIAAVTWMPENPVEGETVTFTVTVQNRGAGMAGFSRLAGYIDDTLQGDYETAAIIPGENVTGTFTWTAEPGAHTVTAVADCNGQITETDEADNGKTMAIYVSLPGAEMPAPVAAEPASANETVPAEPTPGPDTSEVIDIVTGQDDELPPDVSDAPLILPLIGEIPRLGSWASMWMIAGAVAFLAVAAIVLLRLRRGSGNSSGDSEEESPDDNPKPQTAAG